MESAHVIEALADEFKRLVGWGSQPKRLPLLTNLATLAGVPESSTYMAAGYIIRRFLIQAIDSLDGVQQFNGRKIPNDKLIRAYRLLFQIEGVGLSAVNRRYRALQLLGLPITIDQFRRPYGAERDLMVLLAEHMCQTSLKPA